MMDLPQIAVTSQPRLSACTDCHALLLLQHGTAKLLGFPHVAMFDTMPFLSLLGLAGFLELAAVFCFSLAYGPPGRFSFVRRDGVAYFLAHAQKSFFPFQSGRACGALLLCPALSRGGGGRAWSLTRDKFTPPSI